MPLTHNVGDIVEVAVKALRSGALTNPSTAKVWVTSPDEVTLNSDDDATKVVVEIGSTSISDDLIADLDLTSVEQDAGTGLLRIQFVATMEGPHGLHIETYGSARGATDIEVNVAHPAATRSGTVDAVV
jgi:hypothetical protein